MGGACWVCVKPSEYSNMDSALMRSSFHATPGKLKLVDQLSDRGIEGETHGLSYRVLNAGSAPKLTFARMTSATGPDIGVLSNEDVTGMLMMRRRAGKTRATRRSSESCLRQIGESFWHRLVLCALLHGYQQTLRVLVGSAPTEYP